MTHIYLSPHPDDAALSCGGQIAQLAANGEDTVIVTLMAGDPLAEFMALPPTAYAEKLWARWGLGRGADATEARRIEDQAAADRLGAAIRFGSYPEAIYRMAHGAALYTDHAGIFGQPQPADPLLTETRPESLKLAEWRALLDLHNGDSLLVPLGVGGHVDHRLARHIGQTVIDSLDSRTTVDLRYYEEYPYSVQHEDAVARGLTEAGIADRVESQIVPLTAAAIEARIAAVGCYTSQISSFWSDRDRMAASIHEYVDRVGGERNWLIR